MRVLAFFLLSLLSLAIFNPPSLLAQQSTTTIAKDSLARINQVPDSTCDHPCLDLVSLLRLESHSPAAWIQQFPHSWMRPDLQDGQPGMIQLIGKSPWSAEVRWLEMSMHDPVFGLPVIPLIPLMSGRGIRSRKDGMDPDLRILDNPKPKTRPISRVYYNQGRNRLSTVDVVFAKSIAASGFFELGANFFRNGGRFPNSDVEDDRFRARIVIPKGRSLLSYHLATTRTSGGFPGNVTNDGSVQFSLLRRKVRRQDHLLRFDLPSSGGLQKALQFQFHQDRRDYTDNVSAMINTEDLARWGMLSGLASYQSGKMSYDAGVHVIGAYGSSLLPAAITAPSGDETQIGKGAITFSEYPVRISLDGTWLKTQEIGVSLGFQYHNRNWHSHKALINWRTRKSGTVNLNVSVFDMTQVPPLAWRNGRIMPLENQPWPLAFNGSDSTYWSANLPVKTVGYRGGRVGLHWPRNSNSQLYVDAYIQNIRGLSYPRSNAMGRTRFVEAPDFISGGAFIKGSRKIGPMLKVSMNYQYYFRSDGDSTALSGIPDHRIWVRLALNRSFFDRNLMLRVACTGEGISARHGFTQEIGSGALVASRLREMFLLHARIDLEIGAAQVFFQWQNLTGVESGTAGFFLPDGVQFQYGVMWSFLD